MGRSYPLNGSDTQGFLWTPAVDIPATGQVVVNAFAPDGSERVVVFNTR